MPNFVVNFVEIPPSFHRRTDKVCEEGDGWIGDISHFSWPDFHSVVSRNSNWMDVWRFFSFARFSDWKSAIQQVGNLRYGLAPKRSPHPAGGSVSQSKSRKMGASYFAPPSCSIILTHIILTPIVLRISNASVPMLPHAVPRQGSTFLPSPVRPEFAFHRRSDRRRTGR
jgi:hypothetical protein